MNFFGMGPIEILLVLLIAFVFLGPERMLDAARLLGKAVREGRRLASELPKVVIEDDDIKIVNFSESPSSDVAKNQASSDDEKSPEPPPKPQSELPTQSPSERPPELKDELKDKNEERRPSAPDDSGADTGPVSFKAGDETSTPRDSAAERESS